MVAVKIFKKSAKQSAAALCHRSEKRFANCMDDCDSVRKRYSPKHPTRNLRRVADETIATVPIADDYNSHYLLATCHP
jgi:hypothetical protein